MTYILLLIKLENDNIKMYIYNIHTLEERAYTQTQKYFYARETQNKKVKEREREKRNGIRLLYCSRRDQK